VVRFPTPFPVLEGGVAVFADAHLGQAERDADDFLEALNALSGRGFRTIVLLGDIFHYFIGDPKFESPLVARVLGEWEALKSAGVALRYVEGNRDFFVRGSRYSRPFAAYGTTDGLAVGGKKYAFDHGERVNTDDLPYRFWRTASKNPVAAAALKVIPGPLARAIVHRTEARLYNTNFKHKRVLPEAHLLLEGKRARQAGYDEVLIGHFHVERLFDSPEGVARLLPAWLEERKHAEISPEGRLSIVEEASASRARKRELGPLGSPS